ncbi:sulfur carrier protein ThiS [Albimonas pacifica]|uniref:Sulfur carrier protein n=1 Tax=Albimonas pacifica TaxID=1114924 RepID=A0A1I3CIJ9_9RHOB|nr:sulfur carrier protein ThiS [Albimonas pacifica]SFH74400.1 sulfur carrier protein [Albimonas pacifica]
MKIMLNGAPAEVQAETLAAALEELGYGEARVATALNEDFVPAGARAATRLAPGDRVEIVAPRQGG